MAGHVDHVVDAAEDAEVAVGGLDGAVAGEVGPVLPVFALLVPAVLRVIDLHEAVRLAADGLEDSRPRVADADVSRLAAACLDDVTVLVVDHRVDAEHSRPTTARLHRLKGRQRAAEEAAVL